jgi:hypothetical protein
MIAFYILLVVISALAIGSVALDMWYERTHCPPAERERVAKVSTRK